MMSADAPSGFAAYLLRSPTFAACTAVQLQRLAWSASLHEGHRGLCVVETNQSFPYLGLVCEGVIGIAARPEGPIRGLNRVLLHMGLPGSTFGEIGILHSGLALGEVSVLSKEALYALIPASEVAIVASKNPRFMQRLGMNAAMRCRELASRITRQHAWSVRARVARVLTRFASDRSGLGLTKPQLAELPQRDIAAAAGCAVEAAARAIAQLEQAGALRRERGRIRYADKAMLRRYAKT